jgi:16S rRNA (adenine1518-N6/adenine1519-N6)-dimethyltransferase
MLPKAKKSYSQNWLVDGTAIKKIIAAADIKPGENVLEIGPGTGILTRALVDAGAKVTAIETDSSLIEPLREEFGDKIELIEGDALSFTPSITSYKLVANIPYSITSDILRRYLTMDPGPERLVLLVQKEVANRIIARPPEMSLLSIVCQLYATCSRAGSVPAGAFRPIPKVDSAIVVLDRLDLSASDYSPEEVISVAKRGFAARRKQLQKNLGKDGKTALQTIGLNQKIRAQELTPNDWIELTHNLQKKS